MITSLWCPAHAHAGLGTPFDSLLLHWRSAHAHAGLGSVIQCPLLHPTFSPRACGLGGTKDRRGTGEQVQPTRMRAWGTVPKKNEPERSFSPRACGLGERVALGAMVYMVQPTRMRAWGSKNVVALRAVCPAHAHAGLGESRKSVSTAAQSSPRACGLGV